MHNKRWVIQPSITPQAQEALEKFPPILRQIRFNRGYGTDTEARTFLKASGRLESALASFELLTTTDFMRAGHLAQQLDVQNRQRQSITKTMQQQAEDSDAFLLFAAH